MEIKKKKIIAGISILLILFVIAFCAYELYISKYKLESTHYEIHSEKITHPFRVVQITDLHNSVFGENNQELIDEVKKAKPDAIFITGDMVNNKEGSDTTLATNLIQELSEICTVYFSYGNQEMDLQDNQNINIRREYESAGAIVLERNYIDTEIGGQMVRIGGIFGYCQNDVYAQEVHREDESAYLKDFQNSDRYKILLCHMPVCFITGSLYDWNLDSVFCGHAHGGQIRLPFVGGLWAPDQGFFPGQMCGVYQTDEQNWAIHHKKIANYGVKLDKTFYNTMDEYYESVLILSRGLGSTEKIPRFNNIPEIVVVDYSHDHK